MKCSLSMHACAEIRHSTDIVVYGFKTEPLWGEGAGREHWWLDSPAVAIWCRNTTLMAVYSHGGNGRARATGRPYPAGYYQAPPSLYRLEECSDVVLTNLVGQLQFPPFDWNFIAESLSSVGNTTWLLTPHCDRPVLFERT